MRTRGHTPAIEEAARLLAFVGEYGAIWFALGILFGVLDSGHREEWIFAGTLGPFAIGINYAVKVLVGRRRPASTDRGIVVSRSLHSGSPPS